MLENISELEQLLIHKTLPYPVYFAFENKKILSLLREVEENDAAGKHATAVTGGYKLVVPVSEPKKLATVSLSNLQAWLPGLRGDGDASQLPTIAVVASYDTFGVAPALSEGSDSNGSGVVALLELVRLFSRLYANPKTQGRYNILFGLTSGGPFNYNGTSKWLKGFDQRVRESIDYAICLNSIGTRSNNLLMHVSKPPDSIYIKQLYDVFKDVGSQIGLEVTLKHKKINISNSRVSWEHEQFSRHRVTAVTLSKIEHAPDLLEHSGGIADKREKVDPSAVAQVVKLTAESLASYIFGHQGSPIEVFADGSSLAVSHSYIGSWLELLSRTPRVAAFMSKSDPLIEAFRKELSEHTPEVSIHNEPFDSSFVFYNVPKAELSIYQVASVGLDLIILVAVSAYLFILFVVLVISTKSLDDLVVMFRRPPTKKFKGA
ncbi:hypothetical protein KP509_32G070400 [Ceratopteris richardii]|nr:hypothetical protein KP509_32G070400 [Ceratopteris richardii]